MAEFDPGPPAPVADHSGQRAELRRPHRDLFWYDWGPIFYRGRMDGSAKVLCIASDPGPTERVAGRTLVGDAGQRVQGFLTKLGLTRSYTCVNAYAYALLPSRAQSAIPILSEPAQRDLAERTVRSGQSDRRCRPSSPSAAGPDRGRALGHQAGCAGEAGPASVEPGRQAADRRMAGRHHRPPGGRSPPIRTATPPDPTTRTPSPNPTMPGSRAADLPFGVPSWLGDDAVGRQSRPKRRNSVERDSDDLLHTIIWRAPIT